MEKDVPFELDEVDSMKNGHIYKKIVIEMTALLREMEEHDLLSELRAIVSEAFENGRQSNGH